MILNLLLGKYGTARMKIMIVFLACALIGFSVLVSGVIAYFRSNLESVYVSSGIWLNGILLAAQIALIIQNIVKRRRGELLQTPTQKANALVIESGYEYQDFDESRDLDLHSDVIWDTSDKPIPLDKILHHKDEFSYQRLYVQKKLYEGLGNENAAHIIRNLFKPWTRNTYWVTHERELKLVKGKDAPGWKPSSERNSSPTKQKNPKKAVPA
ncbi:MAG: hypothetical protein AAFN10_18205 [Bacteroidota bacterium]